MQKTGVSAPASFSVLSYNIHVFGNSWASCLPNSTKNDELRTSQIAEYIQNGSFEFIALQELFEKAFVKKFHQLNFFKSIYATPSPKKSFFNIFPPLMSDGLLLLSKYRITDCISIPLIDSKGMEKMVSRSVMSDTPTPKDVGFPIHLRLSIAQKRARPQASLGNMAHDAL